MTLAFLETPIFTKRVVELLEDEELATVQNELFENPEAGVVITGSGGLRKLRVRLKGGGKRGGARMIYYRLTERQQIFLLLIYTKARRKTSAQSRSEFCALWLKQKHHQRRRYERRIIPGTAAKRAGNGSHHAG